MSDVFGFGTVLSLPSKSLEDRAGTFTVGPHIFIMVKSGKLYFEICPRSFESFYDFKVCTRCEYKTRKQNNNGEVIKINKNGVSNPY